MQGGQPLTGESGANFSAGIKENGSELIHTAASVMPSVATEWQKMC